MVSLSFPQVEYKGAPEDATLVLNKGLSTPYNVAQRKFLAFYSRDPKSGHSNCGTIWMADKSSIKIVLYSDAWKSKKLSAIQVPFG